jgi:dTDP-4-amino-4,6-dideoxygalactose transaminase
MVPFLDLKAQYKTIKSEIQEGLNRVLDNTSFVLGQEVAKFEEEFSGYCNTKHGIAVNSGTSALHLALLAGGIGPGDEVISVSFTFVATVAAVLYTGARPVLVDVDPITLAMDPAKVEKAITSKTKAILPVHIHGQTADMDPILEIARRKNLIVIEDAAQAHGAEYKGRRAGGIGEMGCFSFYPGKNLGAYGEGGMVVTNNPDYAQKIRMLRDWGQAQKYNHVLPGYNYRMEGFQGAVLGVKLRYLEQWTEARRAHAGKYDQLLADSGVMTPVAAPYSRHVYHVYAIRSGNRDNLQKAVESHKVQTGIHYPIPVHLQKAYCGLGYKKGDFPCTERAASEVLSLPMYAELTQEQLASVCFAVKEGAKASI